MTQDWTPRRRVLTAVSRKEPDRVPIDFAGTGATSIDVGAYEALKRRLGVDAETEYIYRHAGVALPAPAILERFGSDTRRVIPRISHYDVGSDDLAPDSYVNEWGVTLRTGGSGYHMPVKYPFDEHSTIEDLKRHRWPDPDAPARFAGIAESARMLHEETNYAVILQAPSQVFSFGEALCGSEAWFIKLATDPTFADYLLAIGVDFEMQWATTLLQLVGENVDIVGCSDEFAGQDRLSISPRMYRCLIKPHQARLFDAIRAHSSAKLWMHSSGNIYTIIPDLIEMGLDILNPVHVSCTDMGDTVRLKREFGRDIAFWGAIDTQSVLVFGKPDDVQDEVRRRIDDLAPGGGYVISSIQNIPNGTPPQNVCALIRDGVGVWRVLRVILDSHLFELRESIRSRLPAMLEDLDSLVHHRVSHTRQSGCGSRPGLSVQAVEMGRRGGRAR